MTNKTLDIAWQNQEKVPGLVSGNDALMIYNSLPEQAKVGLSYDESSKTIIGSTPFAVANLDSIAQEYGARTPNLRDLSRPEVMRIAKDKHYIDSRNLVARTPTDTYDKNNGLLKTIYELAEQQLGKIEGPFMIEGFNFVADEEDKTGYGLKLAPTAEFKAVQDERLGGKNHRKSFADVDELGLPNFDKNGSRTWYARDNGLSRLCLYWYLYLYSVSENLAVSNDDGRVVFLK